MSLLKVTAAVFISFYNNIQVTFEKQWQNSVQYRNAWVIYGNESSPK